MPASSAPVRRLHFSWLLPALLGVLWTSHPVVRAQDVPYTFYQVDAGFSPAMDVNDDGTVVGWWVGPPVSSDPNTNSQGYVWTRATGAHPIITDAATVNQFPLHTGVSDPTATLRINRTGTIAGVGCPQGCGTSDTKAAIWNSSQGLVFLGSFDGGVQTSAAAGINDSSQVVGYSWGGGYNNFGPFIWSGGGLQHLAGFDGLNGYLSGINEDGVVVGAKGTGSRNVAFVWSAVGGQTDIPDIPGATTSIGFSINDSGVVVGRYLAADNTTYRVFRWSATSGTEDLNAPAGFPELLDINNDGDVVATIIPPAGSIDRVPYIYRNGSWTNLNDLLPSGSNFTLYIVEAINNRGWIVGEGFNSAGFVLIPPNRAPVAADDAISTPENTATNGTLGASDPDGDPLTYSVVANAAKGTATITNAATGAFTYTPNGNATGTDSFTFKASDGSLDSNTARIGVTITPGSSCATNVSASVAVSQGPLKLNKKAGRYTRTVTLKNSDGAVAGPVSLVLDGLSGNRHSSMRPEQPLVPLR
jgi:hypothetical protein